MPDSSPKYQSMYFQPNQFSLFLSHPNLDWQKEGDPDGSNPPKLDPLINDLVDRSTKIMQGFDGFKTARLSRANTHNFEAVPGMSECYASKLSTSRSPITTPRGKSSLVFVNIEDGEDDQIKLFRMITGLEAELSGKPVGNGLTLEAVSPNWLVRGVSEGSGTGGPGGWPVAYRGAPELAPFQIRNLRVRNRLIDEVILWVRAFLAETFGASRPQIQTLQDIVTNTNKGKDVHVIILDSVPTSDTQSAYLQYKDRHPLINSLLKPDGRLTLYRLDPAIKTKIEGLMSIGHDYDMSDHGLFIAGIIHTIAPCAKLHLVEVLNCYGMGSPESIITGMKKALEIMQIKPEDSFVVNCSLTVDLPQEAGHLYARAYDSASCFVDFFTQADRELEKDILKKLLEPLWIKRQRSWLEHLCDTIYAKKSRVIAAAGNDRKPGQEVAPQARIPAALESVQGVGALPRTALRLQSGRRRTSSYSNVADTPGHIGIATLGGEAGEEQGLLGLYLGKFPGGEPNNTNWAWWPGTSFATPIVSGITALGLSDLVQSATAAPGARSRQDAQQAIDNMYRTQKIIQESRGESEVDILDIIQG